MREVRDLTGQRFGRLTAIRRDMSSSSDRVRWICRCDCGNEKSINASALIYGATKSCGCLRYEISKLSNTQRAAIYGKKEKKRKTDGNLYSKEAAEYCLNCPLPECVNCLERGGLEAIQTRSTRKFLRNKFIEYYSLGLSDEELAKVIHKKVINVYHQRYRYGLPQIPKGTPEQRKEFAREWVQRVTETM